VSTHVRNLKVWFCYTCKPTEALKKIQINKETSLMNISAVYSKVKPPLKNENINENSINFYFNVSNELKKKLNNFEIKICQFFSDQIFIFDDNNNSVLSQVGMADYLNAKDLRNLHQISKNIRSFFCSIITFPGLFKTVFGKYVYINMYVYTGIHTYIYV
jgi:hypothetical protein